MNQIIPTERVQNKILLVRGMKIMLDRDLADLYGVTTKQLNQTVTRNPERFPPDFMFVLSKEEWEELQLADITEGRGGVRYLPRAFTEEGVAMLSGVMRSPRAI